MQRRTAVIIGASALGVVFAASYFVTIGRNDSNATAREPASHRGAAPRASSTSVSAPSGNRVPEVEAASEPTSVAAVTCEHPFVPATRGRWWRYRWRASDQETHAELHIRVLDVVATDDGDREVSWSVRVGAEDGSIEATEFHPTTRCVANGGAEEPWFGILETLALEVHAVRDPERWRWPATLTGGRQFSGTTTFDARNAEARTKNGAPRAELLRVTRAHTVRERERVTVPAGAFDAWRVEYDERQSFGGHSDHGTGTLWVAEHVGLIESRTESSNGILQMIELVARGD